MWGSSLKNCFEFCVYYEPCHHSVRPAGEPENIDDICEIIDTICDNIDDIYENFFNNFDFLNHRGKSGSGSIPRVLWMPPKMLFLIASFPRKRLNIGDLPQLFLKSAFKVERNQNCSYWLIWLLSLVPSLQHLYTIRISEIFYEKLKRVNFQENPKPLKQISWIQNWEQENAISFLVLKRALSSIIENVSKGTESLFQEVFPLNPKVNGN